MTNYDSQILEDAYDWDDDIDDEYLYHVTLADKLPSIAEQVLVAIKPPTYSAYTFHSKYHVFLGERAGIRFWFNNMVPNWTYKLEDEDDYLFPVVLRVNTEDLYNEEFELEPDHVGSADSSSYAVKIRRNIPARLLEVWDGEAWESVAKSDPDFLREVVLETRGIKAKSPDYWILSPIKEWP